MFPLPSLYKDLGTAKGLGNIKIILSVLLIKLNIACCNVCQTIAVQIYFNIAHIFASHWCTFSLIHF